MILYNVVVLYLWIIFIRFHCFHYKNRNLYRNYWMIWYVHSSVIFLRISVFQRLHLINNVDLNICESLGHKYWYECSNSFIPVMFNWGRAGSFVCGPACNTWQRAMLLICLGLRRMQFVTSRELTMCLVRRFLDMLCFKIFNGNIVF